MTTFNLNELTNRQLRSFLPVAALQQNLIVNDVPADLYVGSDWNLASSVVSGLLFNAVNHVRSSCIRVSAKIIGDMIMLQVTDNAGYNDCGVVEGMQGIPYSQKIGTVVGMRSNPAA